MARKLNLFSSNNRKELIKEISSSTFDVIVIGGGITGAGICLDAASRGFKVCLVEMSDFASGTSSKSTKLIHGGLRYLEQFKFSLIRETGKERAILHNLAPHIVKSEKMLLPITKGGKLGKISTFFALQVYDYLAKVDNSDKKKMFSKTNTLKYEPLLRKENVIGGALYSEYRTDDSRLTIDILKKSYKYGALPINYIKFEKFLFKNEKIAGATCRDVLSNKKINITSKSIINASGSWTDEVLNENTKKLILSKGIHIVIPSEKFPLKQSVYFDAIDDRMIFAIPRNKIIYIGTTDTVFDRKKDNLRVLKKEVKYLIDSVNKSFTVKINENDILSSWVGIRPLIKEKNKHVTEISRKDEIFISKNGLITIAGGKLTGYRKMSERAVDLLCKKFFNVNKKCNTKNIKLYDTSFEEYLFEGEKLKASKKDLIKIYNIYGSKGIQIFKIQNDYMSKIKNERLLISELIYCLKNEMCHNLLDFFSQRNAMIYFEIERINSSIEFIKNPYMKFKNIPNEEWKKELYDLKSHINEITTFI